VFYSPRVVDSNSCVASMDCSRNLFCRSSQTVPGPFVTVDENDPVIRPGDPFEPLPETSPGLVPEEGSETGTPTPDLPTSTEPVPDNPASTETSQPTPLNPQPTTPTESTPAIPTTTTTTTTTRSTTPTTPTSSGG
jgi:hypothetical protein